MVDNEEQGRFGEKNLFEVENEAITKCLEWEMGDEIDLFTGKQYGYKRFSHSVVHQREIKFHKREGKHVLEWNLILSPEFERHLNVAPGRPQWHRESAFYSSEYGIITKTQKFTAALETVMSYSHTFLIKKIDKRNG